MARKLANDVCLIIIMSPLTENRYDNSVYHPGCHVHCKHHTHTPHHTHAHHTHTRPLHTHTHYTPHTIHHTHHTHTTTPHTIHTRPLHPLHTTHTHHTQIAFSFCVASGVQNQQPRYFLLLVNIVLSTSVSGLLVRIIILIITLF